MSGLKDGPHRDGSLCPECEAGDYPGETHGTELFMDDEGNVVALCGDHYEMYIDEYESGARVCPEDGWPTER